MMSHSVRQLWTGAIMVLMGCQAVPSAMTDGGGASHNLSSERAAAMSPRTSVFPRGDTSAASEESDSGNRDGNPDSPETGVVDQPEPSLHQSVAETHRTALFSFGSRTKQREFDRAPQNRADHKTAESIDGNSAQQQSVLHDVRSRLFGTDSGESSTESMRSPHPGGSSVQEFPLAGADPQSSSPVQQIGHQEFAPGRRHSLRILDAPLEAPTPFSAIAGRTAAVEPVTRDDPSPATSDPENIEQTSDDSVVGSLFDVFGIGGDRAGSEQPSGSATLRRATTARLQRPPTAGSPAEPAPSVEVLTKSLQTVHWQEELDRLTTLLETQLALQTPGESTLEEDYYIRQHVALRLLYLIGSRRPEAIQAIPNCDPDQQEFWTELLWALSNVFDDEAMPDQAERARETAERLRAALTHITPRAGLNITQTQFCRQINGFGNYLPFERDEFSSGQAVLIYTEVENFVSRTTPDGEFLTTLQSTLRIHEGDVTGPIVFEEQLPATEDLSRSRRRDYFHSYRITLPPGLSPGPHVLTLTMRDENSQKLNTTSLKFLVH